MKITALLSESGMEVNADNDEHWELVTAGQPGHRPVLYCPDSVSKGCSNRLVAIPRPNKKKGTVTRYFAFHPSVPESGRCEHAAVTSGIVRNDTTRTGETHEHAWLKQHVLELAIRYGYKEAKLEESLADGKVRADVFVPHAARSRVEIQRVATDIPTRTGAYPDTIWLLRAAFSEVKATKNSLFSQPCVQVRITRFDPAVKRYIPAQPWQDGDAGSFRRLSISATATVLTPRDKPTHDDGFFRTQPLDLDVFLQQVWAGDRLWYPRGHAHKKLAGWALTSDMESQTEWMIREAERQRVVTEMDHPPVESDEPAAVRHESSGLAEAESEEPVGDGSDARAPITELPHEPVENHIYRLTPSAPPTASLSHQKTRWWHKIFTPRS